MALEHKSSQPPALRITLTLTKEELEQKLWSAYRLGVTAGEHRVNPPQQPMMPQCPKHKIPLWLEPRATADGSWLYCPFCRQDARNPKQRQTDALHKIRLSHIKITELNPRKP